MQATAMVKRTRVRVSSLFSLVTPSTMPRRQRAGPRWDIVLNIWK